MLPTPVRLPILRVSPNPVRLRIPRVSLSLPRGLVLPPVPDPSGTPVPGPGSEEGVDAGSGSGTPPGGGASASGVGLARTGSDAAANWILGAGGTLVVLGAAFTAAGRRVRRRGSGS